MADRARASHILLMFQDTQRSRAPRTKGQAQARIEELKELAGGGADFAELARQHSDCPSADRGGDLGSFGRGEMVKELERAVFDIGVGEVSGAVESLFGYHLIKRTG